MPASSDHSLRLPAPSNAFPVFAGLPPSHPQVRTRVQIAQPNTVGLPLEARFVKQVSCAIHPCKAGGRAEAVAATSGGLSQRWARPSLHPKVAVLWHLDLSSIMVQFGHHS